MRSQRIGQGFESPYLHQIKDTAQGVLCFGGDNAGQHTARFAAQGAQVCGKAANLMSRIKVFASILCLNFNFLSYRQSKADRVRQVPRAKIKHNNREAYYASRLFCFPCSFILCFYMLSATSLSGVLLPKEACPCIYLAAVPAVFNVGNAPSTKFHTLSSQPSVEVWNETDCNVVRSFAVPSVLLAVE